MARTKRRTAENEADIENTEIFYDILRLIPGDHAELLALVTKNENERTEKAKGGGLPVFDASEISLDTPGIRHWNAIMRLRAQDPRMTAAAPPSKAARREKPVAKFSCKINMLEY
jgi:hypothetical protein